MHNIYDINFELIYRERKKKQTTTKNSYKPRDLRLDCRTEIKK